MSGQGGGPAFPVHGAELVGTGLDIVNSQGMTLRDWFAGQALAGQLASAHQEVHDNPAKAAMWSYEYADAMLAARKKEPTP